MNNTILMDTWGWLTLYDASERKHKEVATLYRSLRAKKTKIYTTTFILDKTFTLLFKRLKSYQAQQAMVQLAAALATENFQLIQINETHFNQTQALRLKYLDKPQISFTDLSSIIVMQEFRISSILTEDAHFRQIGLGFELLP